MGIEFYNKRKQERVIIDELDVQKTTYGTPQDTRYAFRAVDEDGTALMKFCRKEIWDAHDMPIKARSVFQG